MRSHCKSQSKREVKREKIKSPKIKRPNMFGRLIFVGRARILVGFAFGLVGFQVQTYSQQEQTYSQQAKTYSQQEKNYSQQAAPGPGLGQVPGYTGMYKDMLFCTYVDSLVDT